ncbi:MAG: aminotransferase class I/II-fold pyridoxal phosphate-dependent enzyme [Planctomycetaceae bacterium]|nr:aminotransferase class I/II-fold pyridoxal phosphate-dependent enzyme [Planctomycetaceae bacterium]
MTDSHPARMGHIPEFVTAPSAPPIYQTTAFDVPDLDVLADLHFGRSKGYIYTRDSNPNHAALGRSVAMLEGAESGAVFASGMGAIGAVLMTLAKAGDHIIAARSLYGVTLKLIHRLEQQWNLRVSYVDACDCQAVAAAVTESTRLCLIETISNPLLEVADLPAVAAALHGIPLIVDSTFTTPETIRPLEHGAAVVVHSASKYLNGHGDVMLGVAAGEKALIRRIAETASLFGQNANPFESWLTQRGLRTLPLRMRHVCQTAEQLAQHLQTRPEVSAVYHPSLASHATHAAAQRLYPHGTTGIVTIRLRGEGREVVNRFMQAAQSIPFSPTLADSRTTISHPATTSHAFMKRADREAVGITDELVRISVGLEPAELLISEINAALTACVGV